MNPGVPGLGLGGLFFLLTALLAPAIELWRTVRGESSAAAWARVGRQFALAVVMVAAIDVTLRGALAVAGSSHSGGVMALPDAALAITVGLLALVLAGAKCLQLALRARALALRARANERSVVPSAAVE